VERELAQRIICGFDGLDLSTELQDFIAEEGLGGVIHFSRNYESPAQMAELNNQIQEARGEHPALFICVDHEGGPVWRFKDLTHFPAMCHFGKIDSPKTTFEAHGVMARELQALGLNLIMAPVADIHTEPKNPVIGERSFGEEADRVERHVSAAVRGLHKSGMISCLKHFPGHGDTTVDSHEDLPEVDTDLDTLRRREWAPFKKGIKSKCETVMTAHLMNPKIDPQNMATFSEKTLNHLREDLRFEGLILSDDLQMKAVAKQFSPGESALKAFQAGCDMVIFKDLSVAKEALDFLKKNADQGLDSEKHKAALRRINEVKNKKDFGDSVYVPDCSKALNLSESQALLKEINSKIS
jgi:beta-N-acetylhexosaminidase